MEHEYLNYAALTDLAVLGLDHVTTSDGPAIIFRCMIQIDTSSFVMEDVCNPGNLASQKVQEGSIADTT